LMKEKTEYALDMATDRLAALKLSTKDIISDDEIKQVYIKLHATKVKLKFYKKRIPKFTTDSYYKKYTVLRDKHTEKLNALSSHKQTLSELIGAYKNDIAKITSIESKCPTCKQNVDAKWQRKRLIILNKGFKIVLERVKKINKLWDESIRLIDKAEDRLKKINNRVVEFKARQSAKEDLLSDLQERYEKCKAKELIKDKYKNKIRDQEQVIIKLSDALKSIDHDIAFITFGIKVFSKDGLPSYLIRSICPHLNIASQKYAQLISENEIKVKFIVDEDGGIDIKLRNKHGGEGVIDQSRGETRIASIITSFAVRDVINPANILVLDEPGEGLDQHNSKLFAQVLKEIAKRFGTVLLTTHSPVILGELDNERRITIEKLNKIARLVA